MASQSSEGAARRSEIIELNGYILDCSDTYKLGKGGFGSVYKAHHKTNPSDAIAVKVVPMPAKCECKDRCQCKRRYLEREKDFADTFKNCEHPNIVEFLDYQIIGNNCYIMLELCDQSLDSYFQNAEQEVPFHTSLAFMSDMAAGVAYLHNNEICHRDLKPQNVLRKDNCVKIADFGLARYIPEDSTATSARGTYHWQAPETHARKPFDVFALGLIFLAVLLHEVKKALTAFHG